MRISLGALLLAGLLFGSAPSHAQPSKSITVALAREPDRLYNPTTLAGQLVANLVFDPLVGLDDQMNPYPVLAATIPTPDNSLVRLSGDGGDRRLIVTMPLRQDVTWSDGEPFTADDVVFTWQLMMNPQSGFDTTVEDKLKNVDKVDDFTIRFTYLSGNEARVVDPERYRDRADQPVLDPLYQFGLYDAPAIYPKHKLRDIVGDDPRHNRQVASIETSDFARNPIGTGPYVLSSWTPGILTFNSRGLALSQRQSQPMLDTVVFRVMPDKNDSLTALSQDQVQVVAQDSLDAGDAPVLDTLPGVRARYTPGNAWEHLTFNLNNPILADSNVRQAIALGINRASLNEAIMFGKADVAATQVPSWSWAFDPSMPRRDFDPTQAGQLLDRAGWTRSGADGIRAKAGQRLSLKFWSTPASFRPGLMAMIKDQLAQIGVELNIDSFSSAALFDTSVGASPQALVSRQFDIVEFAWISSYDPGTDAFFNMHSASIPSQTNGYRGGNYGDYKNPRNDQLLDQLQRSLDPSFRTTALHEAQGIWQSDLPVLPLLLRPITTATSTRLTNFRPTPALVGETWNIEQWDLQPPPPTP